MHTLMNRSRGPWNLVAAFVAVVAVGALTTAHAAQFTYVADLDGPSESPPNASPGTGFVQVDVDDVAHTMRISGSFGDLLGTTTAAHIHAPTELAGSGIANVATTTPSFVGFPLGVTSGSFDFTLDTTLASSYNASFITASGGSVAAAEAALFQSLADGKAYFNVHSTSFGGGEIRGFPTSNSVGTDHETWGGFKSLYR